MIIGISGKIGSGKDTVGHIIRQLTCPSRSNNYIYVIQTLARTGYLPVDVGHNSSWEIKKYAGKLKQIVALLTGCRVEELEDQEFKQRPLGDEWRTFVGTTATGPDITKQSEVYDNMTYRTLLQKVGTEAMRDVIHTNVWVNALFADYKEQTIRFNVRAPLLDIKKFPNWIITDMRFPNEMDAVQKHGGITIRVNRPLSKKIDNGDGTSSQLISMDFSAHPSETSLDNAKFDYVVENDGTMEELVEKVKEILIKEKIINEI